MSDFTAKFRVEADPSGFVRGMDAATSAANNLKRDLGQVGLSLNRLIGVAALTAWFKTTISDAIDLRDAVEKVGGKVDYSTAAVARLGDGFKAIRETTQSWSIGVLGFFAKAGEGLGFVVNQLRGVSREQELAREAAAKAADEAEKRLKKSREENSPEKLAAAEKALQAARRQNLLETESIQGRINILNAEWKKLNEEIDKLGANTVERKQRELELEKLTGEIRKANADQDKQVNDELKAFFDSVEAGSKALLAKETERTRVAAELAELAEREAAAKAKALEIEADLKKLNDAAYADAVGFMTGSTLDREKVQDASDATLREIMRRKQGNLTSLGAGGGGLTFDDFYFQRIQLQNDIQRVKAELDLRSEVRRSVSASGIEGARRSFQGDPFVFDRLVEQFVADSRTTKDLQRETVDLLRDLKQQQRSGVAVVNLNKK